MSSNAVESRRPTFAAAPALLSAALAVGVYAVTLGGTWVYDDFAYVVHDPRVQSPSRWIEFWTNGYMPGSVENSYRPLASMSYALQWWLHGDRPWVFHAFNILAHAVCAAAVAELARRLAAGWLVDDDQSALRESRRRTGRTAAYVAGMLFAIHPIHVEAVANVVGRSELLCAFPMILGLILFLRRPLTIGRTIGIGVCFVGAVLSKEQGFLLPVMILTMALLRQPRRAESSREKRAGRILLILLTWLPAAYIVFRESRNIIKLSWDRTLLDWTQNPVVRSQGIDRLLVPLSILGRYVALFFAPLHPSLDYGAAVIMPTVKSADPYLWLGVAAAVVVIALALIAMARGWRGVLFCLIAAATSYAVIGNWPLMITGVSMGERLTYLPSVFVLVAVGISMARLPAKATIALASLLVVVGSARTISYSQQWSDRLGLYRAMLAAQPKSVHAHLITARELIVEDKLDEARQVLADAPVLPGYGDVLDWSAYLAIRRGQLDEATRLIDQTWPITRNPQWMLNLREEIKRLKTANAAATRTATTQPAASP
jgi:hypothetical protein